MKAIYVDEMFLLNLIINYFILLATAKLCAFPLKRIRFAAAAALGALYSVMTLLPEMYFLLHLTFKGALGILMVLISFGGERKILRPFVAFVCVSAAFGGTVLAASILVGGPVDSGLYIIASKRTLALSFAACYLALTLVFKRLGKRRMREIIEVQITLGESSTKLRALHDTGNELFDPLSGLPVMVIEASALTALLPEEALSRLELGTADFLEGVCERQELKTRFRLVPFSSTGVKSGLLPVFRPDALEINGKVERDVLIGICGNTICPDNEFSAIF